VSRPDGLCCACLSLAITTSCQDEVEIPTSPEAEETDAIVLVYETPTGSLDTASLPQTLEDARARIEELDIGWMPRPISETLTRLRQRFAAGGMPADPAAPKDSDRADMTAVIDLTHVCTGWDDPQGPPNMTENGTLQLTAIVEKTRLQRQLWGTASACRWRLDPVENTEVDPVPQAFVDGTLILYLYGPLPQAWVDADFLLRFTGQLGRQDQVREREFDFRFVDGVVELRHPVADGEIIVGIGLTTFTLRASNATYTCDRATLSCS